MVTLHKVQSKLAPGVGTSSGARISQKLLRCLPVSCADETYWPGVTPSNRLKRCVKWLCVLKPRSSEPKTWEAHTPTLLLRQNQALSQERSYALLIVLYHPLS